MDTQALKAFLAVANHNSFSLAADQLFITQPAISKRISVLEGQLNCQLFERHNRSVKLTHSGQVLLPKAQAILALMADTELAISNSDDKVAGPLALGTSHHIGLHKLPPVLSHYVDSFPEVKLQLEFMGSELAYQAIKERKLDLALTTLENQAPENITQIPLWQDEMQFVCGHQHPLSQSETIPLAELARHPAILPTNDTITYELLADQFSQQQLQLNSEIATNYLETNKMLATVGLGWSLLPDSMIDDNLHVMQVDCRTISRQLGIIYDGRRTLPNTAKAFLQSAQQIAPQA